MSAAEARAARDTAIFGFLSNPVVVWTLAIVGVYLALRWFLPGLYSGTKDATKKAFTDLSEGVSSAVDATQRNLSTIVGAPSTDAPNRSFMDTVKGLLVPGDRSLSDIFD